METADFVPLVWPQVDSGSREGQCSKMASLRPSNRDPQADHGYMVPTPVPRSWSRLSTERLSGKFTRLFGPSKPDALARKGLFPRIDAHTSLTRKRVPRRASILIRGHQFSKSTDRKPANGGNRTWIEIDGIPAADGAHSYTWDTANVLAGNYYLMGCLYTPSTGALVSSHLASRSRNDRPRGGQGGAAAADIKKNWGT